MTNASNNFLGTAKALRFTFALLLMQWPIAHAAGEPLPMWEIRSTASKGAVYLLGSVHVCRASCLQFPESVLRRFRTSQALALELDPTNPEVASKMRGAALLPPGQTLSNELSPSQLHKLQDVLTDLGLPTQMVDNMRPIMAATLISTLVAQKQGLTVQDGIDTWFLEQAQNTGKPVRELETIERQLAALTSGSERDQIAELDDTLDMIAKHRFGPYLEALVKTWQTGNLTGLAQLLREGLGNSQSMEEALINKRNAEMANKLTLWLTHGEQIFVVIGAAHIAGPGNVAELLSLKGFSVRQVNNGE